MRINVKNLLKKYGDKTVLNIDELTIESGKITGIVGSNGCGKTTFMNIVSGIDGEYVGDLRYDGKVLDGDIISNMTYVFQKPYLFRSSVYDNIAYPLRIRKIDLEKEKELVSNIIKKLEIENLIDNRADLLSGGESQKVALARSIVFRPRLLLLDEPTSNIDPDSIKIMEREIMSFNKDTGSTVVIVTHNMEQSIRICDNIFDMNQNIYNAY